MTSDPAVAVAELRSVVASGRKVACVLGDPVRHSLSPAIHNAAFAASGVDAAYIAIQVAADELAATVEALLAVGFLGASVTMPHKEAAFVLCSTVGPTARRLGSLNTLIPSGDAMHGDSTDGLGCIGALREGGFEPRGRRVVVLGAGATARACIVALADAGVADIAVLNRSEDRAVDAVSLAPHVAHVAAVDDISSSDAIINTTPVGMASVGGGERVFDHRLIDAHHVVLDAVYQPLETDLLASARAAGATCIDGLWMLVHQAVEQQRLWTNTSPDPRIMRAAAEHELARRRG